jgi:hypothetical protein
MYDLVKPIINLILNSYSGDNENYELIEQVKAYERIEGVSVIISCYFKSNPRPIKVEWLKNGKIING